MIITCVALAALAASVHAREPEGCCIPGAVFDLKTGGKCPAEPPAECGAQVRTRRKDPAPSITTTDGMINIQSPKGFIVNGQDQLNTTRAEIKVLGDDLRMAIQQVTETAAKDIAEAKSATTLLTEKVGKDITAATAAATKALEPTYCSGNPALKWSSSAGKCVPQVVQLATSKTKCTATAHGLVKLDDKGKMVMCAGSVKGKEKYVATGGGGLSKGIEQDSPALSCAEMQASSPFLVNSGRFWVLAADKKTAVRNYCEFNVGSDPVNMGGNGADKLRAGAACFTMRHYFDQKANTKYWVNRANPQQVTCDMANLADGFAEKPTLLTGQQIIGVVNYFAPLAKSYSKGYAGVFEIAAGGSQLENFKVGSLVIVHQAQNYKSEATVGRWEYNAVRKVVITGLHKSVYLVDPLKQDFVSGEFGKEKKSQVAQLVTVPYADKIIVSEIIRTYHWDGVMGGVTALRATDSLTVDRYIYANGVGFRGGRKFNDKFPGGSCKSDNSAGDQGESWTGRGTWDKNTGGFGCCNGPANSATAYKGRGARNAGGGGGGAGACHGGGGAGGGHFNFDGSPKCPNNCGHRGATGDGAPECRRAGNWAQHGSTYGGGNTRRLTFGSGGGAGNSYSPSANEDNRGGPGGGTILLDGGKLVTLTGGSLVEVNGYQGWPRSGTSQYNWWVGSNSQDGSGGGGAGGSVVIVAKGGKCVVGNNRMNAVGGACGAKTGWGPTPHQGGGAGGRGYQSCHANTFSGGGHAFFRIKY